MELIDTHCHLTFEGLIDDIDAVITRSTAAGVTAWITVGTDMNENHKAVELANRFDNLYAALAIHPHDAKNATRETINEIKKLARQPKVVAVGETGLDYHYNHSLRDDQKRIFAQHLTLAAELRLPVIIHCRKAFDETLQILEQHGRDVEKIVFHCFSGSAEQAKILIAKEYYFSFTGVVTFKNAEKTRKAAAVIPLDRLMLETDCPYMSPEPKRKQKINEPALLIHTASCLARLKNINLPDFGNTVTATTKSFFNLPGHPA